MSAVETGQPESNVIGRYINGGEIYSNGISQTVINPATGQEIKSVELADGVVLEQAVSGVSSIPCMA